MKMNLMALSGRLVFALILFCTSNLAFAGGSGYPFDPGHNPPFDFTFGNHIDTHQQSRLLRNGTLFGFLYVTNVGEKNGIPIAEHCSITKDSSPGDIDACYVGWSFRGRKGWAQFVYHEMDHPLWLMDRVEIPQPGAFAHFHWLGAPDKAGMLDADKNMVQEGFYLQLRALRKFYFKHGKETVLVRPGLDIATHVNLVTSFPILDDDTGSGH